jgi:hypothetical protein
MTKTAFRRKLFTDKMDFNENFVKFCLWSLILYGAENWTLRKADTNTLNVLICDNREGLRRLFGSIV